MSISDARNADVALASDVATESAGVLTRRYVAEHTLAQFHASDAMVRGIMGPVGSGKSTASAMEIFRRASQQAPWRDGVRRTRWAVVRNTYGELRTTTMKTWKEWFPEYVVPINHTPPMVASMRGALPDGTQLDAEIVFLALDKPRDVRHLLSWELTGVWFNEAREFHKTLVSNTVRRLGRFPPVWEGGATWRGLWMDTNPPDDDHWWYKLAEEVRPNGWKFFRQPGALLRKLDGTYIANPLAENIAHLDGGYDYYYRQIPGQSPEEIKVYILGQYGSVFDGKPVYQGVWNDEMHVAREPLEIYRGLPLLLGFDFGLTPACAIGQLSPRGQLRILRELQCEYGGLRQFLQNDVRPLLMNVFPGMKVACCCDPAGTQKSQADEHTCLAELQRAGIPTEPARTNDFLPRRQAVITFLTRMVDGQPGFILDPSCTMLRKGFNGGYQFKRMQVSGEERYQDVPYKNSLSHLADACQYLCMMAEAPLLASQDTYTRRGKGEPEPRGWGAFT